MVLDTGALAPASRGSGDVVRRAVQAVECPRVGRKDSVAGEEVQDHEFEPKGGSIQVRREPAEQDHEEAAGVGEHPIEELRAR